MALHILENVNIFNGLLDVSDILWSFIRHTFCVHLVHFSGFGIMYKEKSSNPEQALYIPIFWRDSNSRHKRQISPAVTKPLGHGARNNFIAILLLYICIPSKVARFFLVQHTKTVKNLPNDNNIYLISTKNFKHP
jgi:hypothetical protein